MEDLLGHQDLERRELIRGDATLASDFRQGRPDELAPGQNGQGPATGRARI